jgi:ABC-type lipoprotein release transport system permease subunit
LVAVLVVTQALVRQSFLESIDYPYLRALGMDRAQLWGLGMARAVAIGLLAAPIAVVVAFVLSPFTPIGLARIAEPDPGFAADALALGVGAVATLGVVLIVAALPALLAARSRRKPELASRPTGQTGPSAAAGALSRAGAPASLTTGVRLALEAGKGRSAVPVRSTLAGAVIGVAAVAAAFGFNASLDHLLTTPRLYGAPWDLQITPALNSSNSTDDVAPTIPVLRADREVADVATGRSGAPLTIQGTSVQGMTFDRVKGQPLAPTVLEGRLPSGGSAEIVLGTQTLRSARASVGSTVKVSLTGVTPTPMPVRVVGRAVFPTLGAGFGLGQGALFTTEYGMRALVPPGFSGVPPPDTAVVRLAPGVDPSRAQAGLARQLSTLGSYQVVAPAKPVDLVNFGRVKNLPLVLAGLLAALAAATLANLLVSSIRRRRRDLAVLKSLGFVPAQVRAAVAWQATTLGVVAAAVGIPVGVAAGRWAWLAFTHELGIVPEAAVSLLVLLAMVPATLLVANLVAVLPARAAARAQPAGVLRSE